ncbi:hypothetical protein Ddc_16195 [Ditylenchus destructor]|nr:hypothetical protein Ddc_16195 [Ditylenchus destructor]
MDSERLLFPNELPNSLRSTFNSPKFIFYFEKSCKVVQNEQPETLYIDNRDIHSLFDPKRLIKRILDCTELIHSFSFVDVPKDGKDRTRIMREIPAGILPAMLVDGVFLVGLSTISRSLAARTGLDGCSLLENGQVDMITDILLKTIENMESLLKSDVSDYEVANDIASITPLLSFIEAEIYCTVLPYLDSQLGRNGGKYIVGNRETWADHTLDHFLEILHSIIVTMVTNEAGFGKNKFENNFMSSENWLTDFQNLQKICKKT